MQCHWLWETLLLQDDKSIISPKIAHKNAFIQKNHQRLAIYYILNILTSNDKSLRLMKQYKWIQMVIFQGFPLVYHWGWSYNEPCTLRDGFLHGNLQV